LNLDFEIINQDTDQNSSHGIPMDMETKMGFEIGSINIQVSVLKSKYELDNKYPVLKETRQKKSKIGINELENFFSS